jgi:hypothetical protein
MFAIAISVEKKKHMANNATNEEVLPFDAPAATAPVQGVAPKGKSAKKTALSDELKTVVAEAISAGIQAGLAAFRQQAPAPAPVQQTRAFPFQGAPVRQQAPKGKGKAPAKTQGRPPVDPNRPRSTDAAGFAKAEQDKAKAAGHDPLTVRTIYKQAYNEALAAQGLPKRYMDV